MKQYISIFHLPGTTPATMNSAAQLRQNLSRRSTMCQRPIYRMLGGIQQHLSPQLLPVALTCGMFVGYRLFSAASPPPAAASTSVQYFTKSWMWAAIGGMGLTIAVATVRSVLKNIGGKQGHTSSSGESGGGVFSERLADRNITAASSDGRARRRGIDDGSPAAYLRIAVTSGVLALLTFVAGVYSLFVQATAVKETSVFDYLPVTLGQMAAASVAVPIVHFLNPLHLFQRFKPKL